MKLLATTCALGLALQASAFSLNSVPATTRAVCRAGDVECKIAVFGGTGGTGSEAVFQALARGEDVVTLARDPARMLVPVGSGGASAGSAQQNDSEA